MFASQVWSTHEFRFPPSTLSPSPSPSPSPPPYHPRSPPAHSIHRREPIEFLKKREWARRVAEWAKQSAHQADMVGLSPSVTSPDLTPSQSSCAHPWTATQSLPKSVRKPVLEMTYPPAKPSLVEQEEEPYIIYSSSPTPAFSPHPSDDLKHAISSPEPFRVAPHTTLLSKRVSTHHRRRSSASIRTPRRSPSLSSIFEVPEED